MASASAYDEIVRALDGGLLAGRDVRELSTESGFAYAVEISSAELRTAWKQARALVQRLGRWPVATMGWNGPVDERVFSRFTYGDEDNSPRAICDRARRLTREDALNRPLLFDAESHYARDWVDVVQFQRDGTHRRVGAAPALEEVLALDLRPDHVALERWLLDWEEARRPTREPDAGGHLTWFEPGKCTLLLLPTPVSEEVPAYLSFYGAEGRGGHERLITVLRSWRERCGAEMVATWGTMLQLNVTAPPQRLDEAFDLAVEQWVVASSTLHLAGVSIRNHARALLQRTEWFLHSHP